MSKSSKNIFLIYVNLMLIYDQEVIYGRTDGRTDGQPKTIVWKGC